MSITICVPVLRGTYANFSSSDVYYSASDSTMFSSSSTDSYIKTDENNKTYECFINKGWWWANNYVYLPFSDSPVHSIHWKTDENLAEIIESVTIRIRGRADYMHSDTNSPLCLTIGADQVKGTESSQVFSDKDTQTITLGPFNYDTIQDWLVSTDARIRINTRKRSLFISKAYLYIYSVVVEIKYNYKNNYTLGLANCTASIFHSVPEYNWKLNANDYSQEAITLTNNSFHTNDRDKVYFNLTIPTNYEISSIQINDYSIPLDGTNSIGWSYDATHQILTKDNSDYVGRQTTYNIKIICINTNAQNNLYYCINNHWTAINLVYQKQNGIWIPINYEPDFNQKMIDKTIEL